MSKGHTWASRAEARFARHILSILGLAAAARLVVRLPLAWHPGKEHGRRGEAGRAVGARRAGARSKRIHDVRIVVKAGRGLAGAFAGEF